APPRRPCPRRARERSCGSVCSDTEPVRPPSAKTFPAQGVRLRFGSFFSLRRHPLREARRVAQLLHPEHRIAQLLRLTSLERVNRQFFELGDDLRLAREMRLAAARRLHDTLHAAPVIEHHL